MPIIFNISVNIKIVLKYHCFSLSNRPNSWVNNCLLSVVHMVSCKLLVTNAMWTWQTELWSFKETLPTWPNLEPDENHKFTEATFYWCTVTVCAM